MFSIQETGSEFEGAERKFDIITGSTEQDHEHPLLTAPSVSVVIPASSKPGNLAAMGGRIGTFAPKVWR